MSIKEGGNPIAASLARLRWESFTESEKRKHMAKMLRGRWKGKKKAGKKKPEKRMGK